MYDPLNHIPSIPMLMDCFAMGISHRHSLGKQTAVPNLRQAVILFWNSCPTTPLENPDGKRTKIHLPLKPHDNLSIDWWCNLGRTNYRGEEGKTFGNTVITFDPTKRPKTIKKWWMCREERKSRSMDAHLSSGETSHWSSELPNFQIIPSSWRSVSKFKHSVVLMPGLPLNHMNQRMQSHTGCTCWTFLHWCVFS